MATLQDIEKRIDIIEKRNKRVEMDKAWETSLARKIAIIITTYLVVVITLFSLQNPQPWKNAIIPALGFFLSTLTLPIIKRYWLQIYSKA